MADNSELMTERAFPTLREANKSRQVEWDVGNQLTLAYRGNELAGEVGEACNVLKKLERERMGIAGSHDTIDHLAEELADVVICADLIAMQAGVDLDAAIEAKFNATSEKVGLATRYRRTPVTAEAGDVSEAEVASHAAAEIMGNYQLRHKLDGQQQDKLHGDIQKAVLRALAACRVQPKQDAPSPDVVTEFQAAYGLLWRIRTTDKAIHEARRSLMAAIGKDGQRIGLDWALRTFGPHPASRLEDLP